MDTNSSVKIFVAYSHKDEDVVKSFHTHLAPLKTNGTIDVWYDRELESGSIVQETIDKNIEDSDIICLMISANFLASKECMKEKQKALTEWSKRGCKVIPILLSHCGWKDDADLKLMLTLPNDGKPITDFSSLDSALQMIYEGVKDVANTLRKIKSVQLTDEINSFLKNTDLLTKSHSSKEEIFLDDIYVYPELTVLDDGKKFENKESAKKLTENFLSYSKVLIAGEDQSGRTALCKKIYSQLRELNYFPIYVTDKTNQFQGNFALRLVRLFKEQYVDITLEEVPNERVVPIIDNFHFAKQPETIIQGTNDYKHILIVVDDVFGLNFKKENLIADFNHFTIKEFSPTLRNELIQNWINVSLKGSKKMFSPNEKYQTIDELTELVNTSLGKIIGGGIMPSYPFFILSIISTYETFEKPLDKDITSQGYCYQALIYMYLRKQGVKNDDIDSYINFLTEFAFDLYKRKVYELTTDELDDFMVNYEMKYNLPIEKGILINNLRHTRIISLDSFGSYSFGYNYLFYFFVAKYFAENLTESQNVIGHIIDNLHINDNAYIAIFISHHSKDDSILDHLVLNAMYLFDQNAPATLSDTELSFFDSKMDIIVKAMLPSPDHSPENERHTSLEKQNRLEVVPEIENKSNPEIEDEDIKFAIDLRRSIKTVEVMGRIIKNRSGSLRKEKLETVFREAMNVHLRMLSNFIEIIGDEGNQQTIVTFLEARLRLVIENREGDKGINDLSVQQYEKLARDLFWNSNFATMYSIINKIIHSLGSNKLTKIIQEVCNTENTPAAFLVKHGILMWYNKNLQIDNIADQIDNDGFSKTAKNIMNHKIVNHCRTHSVSFKDHQKIERRFKIPTKQLLIPVRK